MLKTGLTLIKNSLTDTAEIAMLNRWEKEYSAFNERRSRRQKILDAVAEGYDTLTEIVFSTGIPYVTAYRLIGKLVTEKKLKARYVTNLNSRKELKFEIPV